MALQRKTTSVLAPALAVAVCLFASRGAFAETVDDTFLLTTSVSPNVVLLIDNSNAMNQIEWHPAFDPTVASSCSDFDPTIVYSTASLGNAETHCGNHRTIFAPENPTLWDGRYLNWYFSDEADPYINEIETAQAQTAGCNQAGSQTRFVAKYRRTRADAAKQVILDVLCLSEPRGLRFGLAEFRAALDQGLVDPGDFEVDPNGGFISVDIDDATPAHAADLEASVGNTQDMDATPLSEALFQIYTYLMPRDPFQMPKGQDNSTFFPQYIYDKQGEVPNNASNVLGDPMEFACQKNFVILVTTGVPTRDDFDRDPTATSLGYNLFGNLIGDYYADGETEVPGDPDESTLYLDDIAKYMQEKDLRPDFPGDQVVDVYTVGFATSGSADTYLQRVADVANGLFFHSQDGDQLSAALVSVLNDIVEKSRSFTAATVPSARTADGGDFYNSFFLPSGKSAFWEGHLRSWHFTAGGDVLDANDVCALSDPDPGECNSGPFKAICQPGQQSTNPADNCAEPFWEAGEQMPPPGTTNAAGFRQLHTSLIDIGGVGTGPGLAPFDTGTLDAADLTVATFTAPPAPAPNSAQYPINGSTALNAEGLADEIIAYGRGCVFGTGVTSADVSAGVACEPRNWTLGDIFHSDPIVVRRPPERVRRPGYDGFRINCDDRTRVIYTGTNGGFLEAFHAGDLVSGQYDEGTGAELFGFMPYEARRNIKNQPVDDPTTRTHYVDGAPQAADVWIYGNASDTPATLTASDWHTVLVGGLREGGHHYYALDVTNPGGCDAPQGNLPYPKYLWEFPDEEDLANVNGDHLDMGQTWGQPIITKVKLQGGVERWVAIVTAGYDLDSDPNPVEVNPNSNYQAASTKGRGIYILDLKNGKVLAEQKFGAVAPNSDMDFAIPSTPSVLDLNADGLADVIYVGDLGGNVWKWVIHADGVDRVAEGLGLRSQPNWSFMKFFDAPEETISGKTYYKNIFQPPAAAYIGSTLWLAFGTGERAAIGYRGDAGGDENNRFYAINDPDPFGLAAVAPAAVTEADLTDVTTVGTSVTSARGYYFKVSDGQKFVTTTVIFAGNVISATFTPSQDAPGDPGFDPCTSRGEGNLFQFDLASGEGAYRDASNNETRSVSIGSGLPTDPKISVGVGGSNNRIVIEKSGTEIESQQAEDIEFGRGILYWRERH